MRYEIVATLGPSSASPAIWQAMIAAGATAFRLNTSHLSLDQLAVWLRIIRDFRTGNSPRIPLVLDLQGSKWRLGEFPDRDLQPGEQLELVFSEQAFDHGVLPVPHADFFRAAPHSNGEIILNDAKSRLEVLTAHPASLTARVVVGGKITAHKGITFDETQFRVETISEKDSQILKMAPRDELTRFAVSYVRDASEMEKYRKSLGSSAYLIAKLERRPAMVDARNIAGCCDELWVCRGDLGAELGLQGMAEAVAAFTALLAGLPVPALMAGQVLEHMTAHPTPTRSEVCYLRDVLAQGYRGFVLSDEAAIGQYPVESCRTAALFQSE
jgi:pyruvate kinase